MNSERGLVLWVIGFGGGFLLYSAYKGKSPLTTLKSTLSESGTAAGVIAPTSTPATVHDDNGLPVAVPSTYSDPSQFVPTGSAAAEHTS